MQLKALKDPNGRSGYAWVVVDTSLIEPEGPYVVNGHPVQWMPEMVEYFVGSEKVRRESARRFFARKMDAQAAIDALALA